MSHKRSDSLAIANEFIRRSLREGRPLTHMQLQKLVFFAQGWTLAVTGEELIWDQAEAWTFGPVYRRLYDALKRYGTDPIRKPIKQGDDTPFPFDDGEEIVADSLVDVERAIVERVWSEYGNYPAFKLSAITHAPGTPWSKVFDPNDKSRPIEIEQIREYFISLATEAA